MKTELPYTMREVVDNSTINCHARCPRRCLYQYILHRAPSGKNYPIGFGVAYHKYREVLENHWLEAPIATKRGEYHLAALDAAVESYNHDLEEEPPENHKWEHLNLTRLRATCERAFEHWKHEQNQGRMRVVQAEAPFDLLLPSGRRYGGRFDQIIEWNGRLYVRDFKTTSRMGASYWDKYLVDHQMTGYVWAASKLSGQEVSGALVQVAYNTKTKGPEIEQQIFSIGDGAIKQWLSSVEREYEDMARNFEQLDALGYLAFPQRTTSCTDYSGCFWQGACMCESGLMIDKWIEFNTVSSVWDFMDPEGEVGVPVR